MYWIVTIIIADYHMALLMHSRIAKKAPEWGFFSNILLRSKGNLPQKDSRAKSLRYPRMFPLLPLR